MSKPLPPIVNFGPKALPPSGLPKTAASQAPVNLDGFVVNSGLRDGPQKIVIYGPGGSGKSTLANLIPGRNLFLDVESGTNALDVARISTIKTFTHLRAVLQSEIPDDYDTIISDSGTKVEELAVAHTLATVPNEKGALVDNVEGYGYGKGYGYVYDTFMLYLADLDRLVERGKNVVLICHECVNEFPNPSGENFIRFEPHLQSPKSGKSSIRNRVVQWADHVLFLGYDVLAKDGKGRGSGTRTIWPQERPDHIAKSRRVADPVAFKDAADGEIWQHVFAKIGGVS